jgi:hypothetical protein
MDSKEQRDEAEGDLLDLIRRNDAQNFLVTIICMEHRWRVEVIDHDAKQTEPRSDRSIGEGDSFTEAWLRQEPTWAAGKK